MKTPQTRPTKLKCLTCGHPLNDHYSGGCLHWHKDIHRWCLCQEDSDGVSLNKMIDKVRVSGIIDRGENYLWFQDGGGKHWRWMPRYGKVWPITIV